MSSAILSLLRFGLDVTLKVTLLLLLAEIALLLLRRSPAALRHSVATFALVGALALPVAALLVPRWQFPVVPSLLPEKVETVAAASIPTRAPQPISALERSKMGWEDSLTISVSKSTGRRSALSASAESHPSSAVTAAWPSSPKPRKTGGWMAGALLVWGIGALLALIRLVGGSLRVRAIARDAVRIWDLGWMLAKEELCGRLAIDRPVSLLASDRVPVAMTSGVRRPVLLLAANAERWPAERRRVVLLHELAHIERRDWIALLIAEVVRALYWFHPLVWVAVGQARRDCEKACDDVVLESGTKPSVYAAHLLGIVRALQAARQRLLPAVPMARPSQFEGRMRAILEAGRDRRQISAFEKGLAVAGVLGLVLGIAAVQPWATCPRQRSVFSRVQAAPLSTAPGFVPLVAGDEKDSPSAPLRKATEKPGVAPAIYPEGPKKSDPSVAPIRASSSCKGIREGVAGGVQGGVFEGVPGEVISGISEGVSEGVLAGVARGVSEGVTEGIAGGIAEEIEKGMGAGIAGGLRPAGPGLAPAPEVERTGFQKASHRDDRSGRHWYSRGMKLHRRGQYEEAIGAFQKSIELGHREGASSYNIACAYARLKRNAEAIAWLRRAADAGFDLPHSLEHDGDLDNLRNLPEFRQLERSVESGEAAAVESRLARLAGRSSTTGEAFYRVGKELLSAGSHAAAAQAFQGSADAGYRVGASLYNEACALARDGKTQQALDLLERALLAGFDDAGLVRRDDDLDRIRSEKRYQDLERLAQDLSLSLPSGTLDFFGYGKHQWRMAVAHYRQVAESHPQIGRAWFNLGYAAIRGGEYEEGTRALERALALDYRKPTTMYNLACVHARRGEPDQAFDWLFKSLDAGFDGHNIDNDRDLESLRGDARFQKALDKAGRFRIAQK